MPTLGCIHLDYGTGRDAVVRGAASAIWVISRWTCSAANAAGYGPYYRGRDPEYTWYIDREGDGIDCER